MSESVSTTSWSSDDSHSNDIHFESNFGEPPLFPIVIFGSSVAAPPSDSSLGPDDDHSLPSWVPRLINRLEVNPRGFGLLYQYLALILFICVVLAVMTTTDAIGCDSFECQNDGGRSQSLRASFDNKHYNVSAGVEFFDEEYYDEYSNGEVHKETFEDSSDNKRYNVSAGVDFFDGDDDDNFHYAPGWESISRLFGNTGD